jgi:hypothetical protein
MTFHGATLIGLVIARFRSNANLAILPRHRWKIRLEGSPFIGRKHGLVHAGPAIGGLEQQSQAAETARRLAPVSGTLAEVEPIKPGVPVVWSTRDKRSSTILLSGGLLFSAGSGCQQNQAGPTGTGY